MHFRLEVALTAPSMGLLEFKPALPKSLFMALLVGGGGLAVNRSHGLDSDKDTETRLSARALINRATEGLQGGGLEWMEA